MMRVSRRGLLLAGLSGAALTLPGCGGGGGGGTDAPSTTTAGADTAGASSAATAGLSGDTAAIAAKNEVLAWNTVALDAIRNGTLGPPLVARALALVHTAMYDAWTAFAGGPKPTVARAPLSWPATVSAANLPGVKRQAVAHAAFQVLAELYPAQRATFEAAMRARGFDPADTAIVFDRPSGIGNAAAAALMGWRRFDGSNQTGDLAAGAYADWTGYAPVNTVAKVNDPTRWQPLTYSNGKTPPFMAPHWGRVKPFAMSSGDMLRPAGLVLPAWGSAAYQAQTDDILALTAALDDRTKSIAEYWANGPKSETPPGHWCLFAKWVSDRDAHTLDDDVKLFFMLGNAVFDASIACWDCKRLYDAVRPITAVRALYAGKQVPGFLGPDKGIGLMAGEAWSPYQPSDFVTPPFAEFTSGHSTFSAASAEILARFTGSDRFGGSVLIKAGTATHQTGMPTADVTLAWSTFSDAATEAGMSRLHGGIHFRSANDQGQASGRRVAGMVWDRAQQLFAGVSA